MPCIHKFKASLNLERLDFKPDVLITGTFNPGWDHLENYATWFYGRTRNNYFWDVLPRLYGKNPLRQARPAEWKAFCRANRIALTDLIASIDDADPDHPDHAGYLKTYRDDLITRHFRQFTLVDIPKLLAGNPTISKVYLTRSTNAPFWRQLWQPVEEYAQLHSIKTQNLMTPSSGARFQVPKGKNISLGDFIFEQWLNTWAI